MSSFVVPLALFLAGVLAVSAIGKLRSADHGRAAFDALQLPVRHPDAAAIALIIAEALVAIGLLTTSGWLFVASAGAAVVLTTGLLVVVIRAHRLGATDDCGCFGEWLPAAIGPRLITRNVVLSIAALAVLIPALGVQALVGAPMGLPIALASLPSALTALGAAAAAALIALATWSIFRSAGAGEDPAGSTRHRSGVILVPAADGFVDLFAPTMRARLVVFVTAGCHACETALAGLIAADDRLSSLVDVYVVQRVFSGSADVRSSHALPRSAVFALDVGGSLVATLEAGPATPVAALIGADGAQAGPLARGADEVVLLTDSILALADSRSD
ncbi:MauE/DoxX family redox-associated membrane protein [Microbacterium sp. PMB16]|uniref:MauE/DoxX family redox-associated membrane protein n=1 Tax=Microbacterium sp. PMB16 TaxID=3120157 RepID=UPI003F4BA8D5